MTNQFHQWNYKMFCPQKCGLFFVIRARKLGNLLPRGKPALLRPTEYIRVRRYRLVATTDLVAKFERNIDVENKIYNYVVKYLEKTYGVKHLGKPFPTTKTGKIYLVKDILIPKILKDIYGLDSWNGKKIGIHSQALRDEYLISILTNFGEYRKTLRKANRMSKEDKENYRNNRHDNNSKHKSWYRKGSLNYLRPNIC